MMGVRRTTARSGVPPFGLQWSLWQTRAPLLGCLLLSSALAQAQDSPAMFEATEVTETAEAGLQAERAPRVGLRVVPSLTLAQTFTDNVRLSATNKQSEQVSVLNPALRVSSDAGRLRGFLDYGFNEVFYAQDTSPRQTQHAMNSLATLELVNQRVFVDFSGKISQQTISALGTQPSRSTAVADNLTEVSSYRLTPYLRGQFMDLASYEARYSHSLTQSRSSAVSDVSTDDVSVALSGATAFSQLGWSAQASAQGVDYEQGRSTRSSAQSLGLSYALMPQLSASANVGRESNNYTSLNQQSYTTQGVGLNWAASEMTRLSASRQNRSFGVAHSVSLEHRTGRTVWKYTDSKDVVSTPSQVAQVGLGSIYDLLFSQFATVQPDPAARARLVNGFLQANNLSPDATVTRSFLTAALSVQRRQDLSLALLGQRSTVTLLASRSEGRRLDTLTSGTDDFSSSAQLVQQGFSVNLAHRLTPDYSAALALSRVNTSGALSAQDSSLRSMSLSLATPLGQRSAASVGVNRVRFSSAASSYTENVLTANLTVQF